MDLFSEPWMQVRRAGIALAAFAILLLLVIPALAQETPVVNAIEVKGLRRIDEGSVRARIAQRAGEPLSSDQVTKDIQEIYKMGYFDDVRVEVDSFEGGVKLIYVVREKPVITRVDFQGNRKMEDDKLRDNITVSSGSIADTILIQENADRLVAFYSSKGYSLAEVVPVLRRVSDSQAVLTYQISEGKKVKVKKIIIEGNEKISDRKIKGAMRTGKWWLLSFLTGKKGYYEKNLLRADVENIKDLYYDRGYIQAVVREPEVELTKNKKKMVITINVFEGEQFELSEVDITGNTVFTEEEIRKNLKSEPNKVFSKSKLQEDVASINDMYGEKGYAAANVAPEVIPDEAAKEVDVDLRIREGEVYTIGRVTISGNLRTRDKVIRREVRLDEGETYNSKLIKRSYQRLSNTNYFEDVKLVPRLRHAEKEVDLDIDVTERKTGSISLGGGYSSLDRIIGTVEFTQGNFRGMGQTLKIKAEFGSVSDYYTVSFTEPWFLGKPIAFSTSVYNTSREYVDYDREATGFTLGFGKELSEYWRAGIVYNLEEANITNLGETASAIIREQEGRKLTSSVSPSISWDTRDNYLNPHSGTKNGLVVDVAGLGGDNRFFKANFDSHWFLPVSEKTTLALRGRFGHATGFAGEDVPLYERFYVGGINTIRGLDFGQGGPRDETGDVIGGLNMVILNAEYIFPLVESMNLYGVVFFDAGSAYDSKLEELRHTTGGGVRWISPMGPIRLEWGYNLDRKIGESQSRLEFSLGSFF